ncbi:hypothetical protein VPHK394_0014 [Vibrio phage K394]
MNFSHFVFPYEISIKPVMGKLLRITTFLTGSNS